MAIGGAMLGFFLFIGLISAVKWWRPLPADEAEAALEAERTVVPQDFTEITRGAEAAGSDRVMEVSFEVPSMACVRVLVAAEISRGFETLSLRRADGDMLVHGGMYRGGDLGWCVGEGATTLTLRAVLDEEETASGPIHYWVLAGEVPEGEHWSQQVRGYSDDAAWRAIWFERERAAAEARLAERSPDGEILFQHDVGPERALALPLSDTTRWAAHLAGTFDAPDEGYLPALVSVAGVGQGAQAPIVSPGTEPHRPLLVIDPADLPIDGNVPCVRVRFDRLSTEVSQLRRFAIPRPGRLELGTAIVRGRDTICPEDGVAVYAVPEADVAEWRITVSAGEMPLAAAPRRPTERLEGPIEAAPHVAAQRACDAGDGESCLTVAEHFAIGRYAPRDLDRAIELAGAVCDVSDAACGVVGDYEQMAERPARAVPLWERGCSAGDGWACVQLGEARRLGEGTDFDPDGASDAYAKARELEVAMGQMASRIRSLDELDLTR